MRKTTLPYPTGRGRRTRYIVLKNSQKEHQEGKDRNYLWVVETFWGTSPNLLLSQRRKGNQPTPQGSLREAASKSARSRTAVVFLNKSRELKSSREKEKGSKLIPTYEGGGKRELDLLGGREANGLLSQGKSPKQGQRSMLDPKRPTDRGQNWMKRKNNKLTKIS